MSKITSKNLHYDDSLPPFLARLKAGQASSDGRHEFAVARPKKARNPEDDAEDEPVYFNEDTGETLTKKEWEDKEAGEDAQADAKVETGDSVDKEEEKDTRENKEKEKLAAIGASKKRKVGKVIGGDDEDQDHDIERAAKAVAAISGKPEAGGKKSEPAKSKGKTGKKGKKIKLSFGDDE
ncbi:hypothetical protein BGZ60DRAFT_528557 [Tricladium varicosporioides]|nr:hypothetical protein BGZ60DRAFT_528557 [Hymenoscyphus varicosporioides]